MAGNSSSGELIYQAVVPGSSSGVYYIPVANLHPSMTFSDLRAVARNAASIEKCFIYPNVAEGWVRVRNYDNFEKAYTYLNGYNYRGCIISASGQNEYDNVYIWDVRKSPHGIESPCSYLPAGEGLGGGGNGNGNGNGGDGGQIGVGNDGMDDGSLPAMDYGGTYFSGCNEANTSMAAFDATYSSTLPGPAFSSASSIEKSANSSSTMNGAASWYPPYPENGMAGSASDDYGSQQPYYYYRSTSTHDMAAAGTATATGTATNTMADTMMPVTETVKIIVKNLSRHATHRELENFLHKAAGGRHKLQEPIRFPRSSKSKKSSSSSSSSYNSSSSSSYNNGEKNTSRQHAFLVFKNYTDAIAALDWLETGKLRGLSVEARFVNETVLPLLDLDSSDMYGYGSSSMNASGNATPTPGTVGTADFADDSGTHSPSLTAMSSSSGHSQSDGSQSHNLVVDGSSAYGRAAKSDEGKPSRDHRGHREHRKHRK